MVNFVKQEDKYIENSEKWFTSIKLKKGEFTDTGYRFTFNNYTRLDNDSFNPFNKYTFKTFYQLNLFNHDTFDMG